MGSVTSLVSRLDGWKNALTGLGDALRDKVLQTQIVRDAEMGEATLEALFQSDDMAARICEKIPEDALRQGVKCAITGSEEGMGPSAEDAQAQADEVTKAAKVLKVGEALADAATWENVFGGAAIFVGVDDGLNVEEELNPAQLRRVTFLEVLTRFELEPAAHYPSEHDQAGRPMQYRVTRATHVTSGGQPIQTQQLIHESRLIVFPGLRATPRERVRNNGWGVSRLQRVCNALRQFAMAYQSGAHLMADNSQAVFKMKGLHEAIAAENDEQIQARMELIDMSRSVARALMLDSEEEFERKQTPMSGVDLLISKFDQRLAAAASMPVAVLMGTAVQGLNSTGDADIRFYYDTVRSWREQRLDPRAGRVFELIMLSQEGPTNGSVPETWGVEWPALWQPTDQEQSALRKTDAERDAIYIRDGVYTPEEVAVSRAGDLDIQIDLEAREAEIERAREGDEVPNDPDGLDPDADPVDPVAPIDDPEPTGPAGGTPTDSGNPDAVPAKDALTGVQINALLEIVDSVAVGDLGKETAILVIASSFPMSSEEARQLVNTVQPREKVAPPVALPPAGGGNQPPQPAGGDDDDDPPED